MAEVKIPDIELFLVNERLFKEANIVWIGEGFRKSFFKKKEEGIRGGLLRIYRLKISKPKREILKKLGKRAEIPLAHFFELIKRQAKGEKGILLTDGYRNIAYVRDKKGELWFVNAIWLGQGWAVASSLTNDKRYFYIGDQIISR
jgi:hypothetical protein